MYRINRITIFSLVFILFIGCKTNSTDNKNDSSSLSGGIDPNENDFEVTKVTGQFEQPRDDQSIFNVKVEFLNNTPNTINNVELIAGIRADYKNEDNPTYYPGPNDNYLTDFEFLESILATQYNGLNNYRGDGNWNPGEYREFNFKIFYTYSFGWTEMGFSNSVFNRTPKKVSLILSYKFLGIDEEYKNYFGVDILKPWKDYQKQLGLRESN